MKGVSMSVGLACKEWASVCAALEEGKQTVLLRKGGIAEPLGEFQIPSPLFFLYPTFVHQNEGQLREPGWLEKGEKYFSTTGKAALSLLARVEESVFLDSEMQADLLAKFHVLSKPCVQARFAYSKPGLHALLVRILRLSQPIIIEETPEYAGCKSWVNLTSPLEASGQPVLDEPAFTKITGDWRRIVRGI
ncbi:MAG: DUF1802 family protein [Gemmataceae bacterium]|nr:DUF1802 family protein [Gemmataceae bacterium]